MVDCQVAKKKLSTKYFLIVDVFVSFLFKVSFIQNSTLLTFYFTCSFLTFIVILYKKIF